MKPAVRNVNVIEFHEPAGCLDRIPDGLAAQPAFVQKVAAERSTKVPGLAHRYVHPYLGFIIGKAVQ
jgi:hypothetical protein